MIKLLAEFNPPSHTIDMGGLQGCILAVIRKSDNLPLPRGQIAHFCPQDEVDGSAAPHSAIAKQLTELPRSAVIFHAALRAEKKWRRYKDSIALFTTAMMIQRSVLLADLISTRHILLPVFLSVACGSTPGFRDFNILNGFIIP